MRVRAVIFDLDGTLLDTDELWSTAASSYVRSRGRVPEDGLDAKIVALSMRESALYLAERYGFTEPPEELVRQVNERIRGYYEREAGLLPGAKDAIALAKAAGARIAAATATDRELVEPALRRLGVLGDFEFIVTCTEVGAGKERPDVFLAAAERLGAPPCEALVCDDSPTALAAASAAGFPTIDGRRLSLLKEVLVCK